MWTPPLVKERVHRDLPQTGDLGLALARPGDSQTIVRQAVVERVRPVGVRVGGCHWDRRRGGGVIRERGIAQQAEGIGGVVEERRAETLDGGQRYAGKRVESDNVAIDLFYGGGPDVRHSVRIPRWHWLTGMDRKNENVRVIGNLVPGDEPVGDEGKVCVV
jgi:hypothetical protein